MVATFDRPMYYPVPHSFSRRCAHEIKGFCYHPPLCHNLHEQSLLSMAWSMYRFPLPFTSANNLYHIPCLPLFPGRYIPQCNPPPAL